MSKNEPIARAELFDNGDDTYRLVANIKIGSFKLEIDKTIDTRPEEARGGDVRRLKTVEED